MPTFQLLADHPAVRNDGFRDIKLDGATLTLHADRSGRGVLVIQSDQPTTISSVSGGDARLHIGWDGTLGYSRFGLEIAAGGTGEVRIEFHLEPAPASAVPTSDAQIEAFERTYMARPSRFPDSEKQFRDWQDEHRQKLAAWLMGGSTPARVTGNAKLTETHDMGAFRVERLRFTSRPGRESEMLLATPTKSTGRAPLLIALHGHEATWGAADLGAFTAGHNDDFCEHFAARGWAVLQPATMDHKLQTPGWTLQGEWTHDVLSSLDHVIGDPRIDPSRVAVCGLSTGAHLAMNVMALDNHVKAGVVGCVFSTWHHVRTRLRLPPHCDCGISSQLGDKIEECDWAALASPKPVQFQYGKKDACFTPDADPADLQLGWNTGILPRREFDTAFAEVKRAWNVMNKPDGVSLHFHGGAHKVDNAAALAWLNQWV
ncbi:MAG: acetylxylan esterase [Planctomycetes bacterium]|nr:acetylxylan esterase [Planctomycetota bacterium]